MITEDEDGNRLEYLVRLLEVFAIGDAEGASTQATTADHPVFCTKFILDSGASTHACHGKRVPVSVADPSTTGRRGSCCQWASASSSRLWARGHGELQGEQRPLCSWPHLQRHLFVEAYQARLQRDVLPLWVPDQGPQDR